MLFGRPRDAHHRERALAGAALLGMLLFGAACQSGSGVAERLAQRLRGAPESGSPDATPDEIEEALQRQLRVAPVPAKGSQRPSSPAFPTRATLRDFYAARGGRLAWCDESGRLLPPARDLLDALRRAADEGLDPEDYSLSRLDRMGRTMPGESRGAADLSLWADFDLLMTTAFFRYASDLTTGRVHPDEVRSEWHAEPPELDLPAALARALGEGRLDALLESLPPPHPGYARLRASLKELRRVARDGGWPSLPNGANLTVGSRGEGVALLRRRLAGAQEPALQAAATGRAGDLFDAAMAERVRQFQRRHGIDPDGIVSGVTLAAMNVPAADRVRQVELNLERWRWIPRGLGEPHVEVNIPGFSLELVREGRVELRSRVVAGKAFTPTPVFSDRIVAVIANPDWNIPDEIARLEYLPELQRDPRALLAQAIRVYKDSGEEMKEVDPASVDWKDLSETQFPYHLRQDPGPENALGRIKFQLTNAFQIYLHDTPARALFSRSERDLSHGCIRVEKVRELADRLLGGASGDLQEALEEESEKEIPLQPPVPIHILYLTAWVEPDGSLRFAPDVYNLDPGQQAAIARYAPAGVHAGS